MVPNSAHLIERAAERMRGSSGLLDSSSPHGEPHATPAPDSAVARHDAVLTDAVSSAADVAETALRAPDARAAPGGSIGGRGPGGRTDPGLHALVGDAHSADIVAPAPTPSATPEMPARFLDISTLERAGLVVGRKSRTRISEEFRIAVGHVLRTLSSNYSAGHGSANLILVTSSRPGEGKSFTAMNLAGCIAQQNQREVLLVDIDAKQRPITYELGLGDGLGLLDLVRDPTVRIEDVIVPTAIPSLSFVPIGARLPSNAEMPLSRPISAVVERLGRRFGNRVIILDAPPCLSTSDPSALAPVVGQILMVVEAERTQRNELVAALELVRVCPTITLLLNKIQLTTSYTFGAYHYFGTYS